MWLKIQKTSRSCRSYRFSPGKALLARRSESLSFYVPEQKSREIDPRPCSDTCLLSTDSMLHLLWACFFFNHLCIVLWLPISEDVGMDLQI